VKYYILAGEASGDLHGSHLIKALREVDPKAKIRCWGGDLMEQAGATLVKHYRDLAFMGFWEVILHLKTILHNLRFCKQDIAHFNPDRIVYIDYPGFNLRVAQWAHQRGFKNHYYISPQVWAWKESRVKQMKKNLDALYVILPFEQPYFENNHQLKAHFVGHPLRDALASLEKDTDFLSRNELEDDRPLLALLPGSRKQEIKKMLPLFLSVLPHFSDHQFVVAGAPSIPLSFYEKILKNTNVKLVQDETYSLLQHAQAALVTSGTATLETALFGVPQMVCYKSSFITYFIGKQLVKLKYISLVNLILNKKAVVELIQQQCTTKKIVETLDAILSPSGKNEIKKNYQQLERLLGPPGASKKLAQLLQQ